MKKFLLSLAIAAVTVLLVATGCGKSGQAVAVKSSAHSVQVSMRLPQGWALEGPATGEMAMFSQQENPENRGAVNIWPAEGKALTAWVDGLLAEGQKMAAGGRMLGTAAEHFMGEKAGEAAREAFAQSLVSRTPKKVGDWEAVEIVQEQAGKKSISVFAKKGDAICEATFYSLPDQWSANEPLFRDSLSSLRLR